MIARSEPLDARAALFASVPAAGEEPALHGPLPPSERDLAVYERVVVEEATTRQAAEEFELSQTRIVQIRDRVAEWIAGTLPELPRLTPRQRLRLAAHTAEARLDHLYSRALTAFRASQGEQTTVRSSDHGDTTITRNSCGDIKYLSLASRIAERKYAVVLRTVKGELEVEGGEDRGQTTENRDRRVQGPTSEVQGRRSEFSREPQASASVAGQRAEVPPVRDCSRFSAPPLPSTASPTAEPSATAAEVEAYDENVRRRRAFLTSAADDTDTVQRPRVEAGGVQIEEETEDRGRATERDETAQASVLPMATLPPALSQEEREDGRRDACPTADSGRTSPALRMPLNRRERRARQRMLEQKLKLRKAK